MNRRGIEYLFSIRVRCILSRKGEKHAFYKLESRLLIQARDFSLKGVSEHE